MRVAEAPLAESWTTADVVALALARPGGGNEPVPGELAAVVAERLRVDLSAVLAAEKGPGEQARSPASRCSPATTGPPGSCSSASARAGPGPAPGRRRRGARRPGTRHRAHRSRGRRQTEPSERAVEGLLLGIWVPPAVIGTEGPGGHRAGPHP